MIKSLDETASDESGGAGNNDHRWEILITS
jgi:hypothetical protein